MNIILDKWEQKRMEDLFCTEIPKQFHINSIFYAQKPNNFKIISNVHLFLWIYNSLKLSSFDIYQLPKIYDIDEKWGKYYFLPAVTPKIDCPCNGNDISIIPRQSIVVCLLFDLVLYF